MLYRMTEERKMIDENKLERVYTLFKKVIDKTEKAFNPNENPDDFFYEMDEMKDLVSFLENHAEKTPSLALMKDMSFERILSGLLGGLLFWNPSGSNSSEINQISEYAKKELARCISIEIPSIRYWCFLHMFEMNREIFALDRNIRIRKATILEKAYFISQGLDFGSFGSGEFILELIPRHHNAKTYSESEKIPRIHRNDSITEIEYLLTALRLSHLSSVGVNWIIRNRWYGSFTSSSGFNTRSDLYPAAFGRRWDKICNNDEINWDIVLSIRNRIQEVAKMNYEEAPRLFRILRRYNRAICSEFVEDEVIDLWIILETIARKIGNAAVSVISEISAYSIQNRKLIENELITIYKDIRNPIFHGGSFDSKNAHYVDDLFIITSNAIRAYLFLLDIDGGFSEYVKKVKSDENERMKLDQKLSNWIDTETFQSPC